MDISGEERRRAFSIWLRTGRWPDLRNLQRVELKFNPWHDPKNGRFTFAGRGRYFGRGSNGQAGRRHGGDFGGGGASGSWGAPDRRRQPPPPREVRKSARGLAPSSRAGSGAPTTRETAPKQLDLPPGWRRVVRNGYEYLIDARHRTRRISGPLTVNTEQRRSRTAQAQAGGPDRRSSDHGGHYIARRFNGPTEAFNHFAQDASFNRGEYLALEDQWARAKRAGRRVIVKIVPVYEGQSQRPSAIDVWFWIDGNNESLKFSNERKDASRAEK